MKYSLGCTPSKLDGTEAQYQPFNSLKLPEAYSYEKILSPILNQGQSSTCVPCSISSYINWNINVVNAHIKVDNKVSINDIYKIRADKFADGMTIKEALHHIYKNGVNTNAGLFKIRKYAMIGNPQYLKYAIISNGPCIGALKVYNSEKDFWNNRGNDNLQGGHAIAIVGWNKEGFIIRNSWGSSWGNKGYTILKYEDFNKLLELWTLIK